MHRRRFLGGVARATAALPFLPLVGCVRRDQESLPATGADSATPDDALRELAEQIPAWLAEAKVPGLALAVIRDGALAWQRSFGVHNATTGAPVTTGTMFEAASMSKPVFAYVVMKLCETGALSLDRPLSSYTTERFLPGDPRLDRITARYVLAHTTGFPNWRSDKEPLAIAFTPGTRHRYSGEGYHYLQSVVTHLLGQPFETYMRDRLLLPFGMGSSAYVWTEEVAARMATPHDVEGKPEANNQSTSESVARYGSAGSLCSTVGDYARFVSEVIAPRPADSARLTRESIEEMLRPQVAVDTIPFKSSWALGWKVIHTDGGDIISHGGDNRGFHCTTFASVARRSGYVAMTNGKNGNAVLNRVLFHRAMQAVLGG